jgi:hypothetical protein
MIGRIYMRNLCFSRDCHTSLSFAITSMVGKDHNKKKDHRWFLNSSVAYSLFNFIKRNMLLRGTCKENAQNLCRDTLRKAPKSSCRPFEQCLKGVGNYLGPAQIKVETRWAHFPLGRGSPAKRKKGGPLGLMLTMSPHISGFSYLFP